MTTRETRIGTTFHESFPLNRPALSTVLSALKETPGAPIADILRETTSLGANYVRAMPRYLRGAGLLRLTSDRLTPLGETVQAHDPHLSDSVTLWLMHYHLSAPLGPGPTFWGGLVKSLGEFSGAFTRQDVVQALDTNLAAMGDALKDRSVETTATVFLGSYTKPEALGNLGLFQEGSGRTTFERLEPDAPPWAVLSYALAHYWRHVWPERDVTNLADLSSPGAFSALFFLGGFRLKQTLQTLVAEGVLDLWRVAPPHQVTRPLPEDALLERLYDAHA